MRDILTIVAVTGATVVATSFDNVLVLVGFLGDPRYREREVAFGMFVGWVVAALIVASVAVGLSEIIDEVPARYMAYLGLVPIGLGLVRLFQLVKRRGEVAGEPQSTAAKGALPVALVMLASSGDTLAALAALFADTADRHTVPMLVTVGLTAALLCGVAAWLHSRPFLQQWLVRVGGYLLPFLLIAIGVYILMNTGTDVVPA